MIADILLISMFVLPPVVVWILPRQTNFLAAYPLMLLLGFLYDTETYTPPVTYAAGQNVPDSEPAAVICQIAVLGFIWVLFFCSLKNSVQNRKIKRSGQR